MENLLDTIYYIRSSLRKFLELLLSFVVQEFSQNTSEKPNCGMPYYNSPTKLLTSFLQE